MDGIGNVAETCHGGLPMITKPDSYVSGAQFPLSAAAPLCATRLRNNGKVVVCAPHAADRRYVDLASRGAAGTGKAKSVADMTDYSLHLNIRCDAASLFNCVRSEQRVTPISASS